MEELVKVNNHTYRIIKLLGHGKGGYSYLASTSEGCLVVLKQIHHEPCSYYTFGNKIEAEQRDYQRLLETGILIPKMIEIDIDKEIIIKEFIDGPVISDLVEQGLMKDEYIRQVQFMADKCRFKNLNIDYYPTNFVVQDEKLYYIDYECNTYMEEWSFHVWGIKYWKNGE